MKITVTNGKTTKSHIFRDGISAAEAIASLGFDFPLPCGGAGRCGKCSCMVDGKEKSACKTMLFADSVIEIPNRPVRVLTAEDFVPEADGVVIDIGTTTVAAALFKDGKPIKTTGVRNPQCAFGADVISRIGSKNPSALTAAIRSLAEEIRSSLGAEEPTVIVGNTAMLAIYSGLEVSKMGTYPFTPPSLFGIFADGAYLPPCPGAFVGADALCSLLWSGADESGETSIVADLGTNGEIALVHGGRIIFTSAAAGPALEGGGISCGMTAADGAVYSVDENGCRAFGGGEGIGLCAGGLIDAVALLRRSRKIDAFGAMAHEFEEITPNITLNRSDIRAYQLCKAAVSAAVKVLLAREGLSVGDIDKFYLSGALGGGINLENAMQTGLLPRIPEARFRRIGNGALLGGALLLSEKNRSRAAAAASRCEVLNLAESELFSEMFVNEINF